MDRTPDLQERMCTPCGARAVSDSVPLLADVAAVRLEDGACVQAPLHPGLLRHVPCSMAMSAQTVGAAVQPSGHLRHPVKGHVSRLLAALPRAGSICTDLCRQAVLLLSLCRAGGALGQRVVGQLDDRAVRLGLQGAAARGRQVGARHEESGLLCGWPGGLWGLAQPLHLRGPAVVGIQGSGPQRPSCRGRAQQCWSAGS